MIKFKDGTSNEEILEIKSDIENLTKTIKELKSMEVGLNFANEERAMDLVLVSKFNTKEDLDIYAKDATHQEVIAKIKKVAQYTKVVDYTNE
jgi:hypothetical protein